MRTLSSTPLWSARTYESGDLVDVQERRRVQQELKAVGVTAYGRLKFASHFLPQILHADEHIKGVAYGRYTEGTGLLAWVEGMLVATDRRVIFLDRKPGFEALDELTYDVVSGVQKSYAWPFASITLHTRIGNYTLRFANRRCIDIFMQYVEKRRLESRNGDETGILSEESQVTALDDGVMDFLNSHDTAVLSTVDRAGNAFGAVVHYYVVNNSAIDILTRVTSRKARNALTHRQAALTVYDQATMQTLQLQGATALEADHTVRDRVFAVLSKPRVYGEHMEYPPVTAITSGAYTVIRVTPYVSQLSDFRRIKPADY